MHKRLQYLALPALALGSISPSETALAGAQAQQAIHNYTMVMDDVAQTLYRIIDARMAMEFGPQLDVIIVNKFNPALAAVDQAFKDPANKPDFDMAAGSLDDRRAKLSSELQRFSDGCSLEATSKSPESKAPLTVTFTNTLGVKVNAYELNSSGKRVLVGTINPGAALNPATLKTHTWVFTNGATGQCVSLLNIQASSNWAISFAITEPELRKSVEPTLTLMNASSTL